MAASTHNVSTDHVSAVHNLIMTRVRNVMSIHEEKFSPLRASMVEFYKQIDAEIHEYGRWSRGVCNMIRQLHAMEEPIRTMVCETYTAHLSRVLIRYAATIAKYTVQTFNGKDFTERELPKSDWLTAMEEELTLCLHRARPTTQPYYRVWNSVLCYFEYHDDVCVYAFY